MEINTIISGISDDWKLLEYKQEKSDQIWFFRKNLGASEIKGNSSLSTLVYFTVNFKPKDSTGLPSKSDAKILYDFEENIIPKVESEAACILVASVVKDGVKDHLFYISDVDIFLSAISKYIEHLNGLEVALEKVNDPKWEIYSDFPGGT